MPLTSDPPPTPLQAAIDAQLVAVEDEARMIRFFEASLRDLVKHTGNAARYLTYDEGDVDKLRDALRKAVATACVWHSGKNMHPYWPFRKIREEAEYAVSKHGFAQTPASPDMDPREKLVILVEELGELAEAESDGMKAQFDSELIQFACMAAMWLVSLEEA